MSLSFTTAGESHGPGLTAVIEGLPAGHQLTPDDVNRDLARVEQIKRFEILPRDFSADEGEVTPTLKLKRRVCEQHFAAEIAALYA